MSVLTKHTVVVIMNEVCTNQIVNAKFSGEGLLCIGSVGEDSSVIKY